MTVKESELITSLQKKGYGYKRISTETGIPLNSVKSFCRRHPLAEEEQLNIEKETCLFCGKPITQIAHHKRKKFCSYECRISWWNAHRSEMAKRTVVKRKCHFCGNEYDSVPSKRKKYCSRDCFVSAMRKGVVNE